MACEIPDRTEAQTADMSFKTGVRQQLDDFANKFIMVFWTFIMVTLDLRGSVWCAITLIPITKPATSNLMLFVFQFSFCLCMVLMFWMLLVTAVPDQCFFKMQLQTPVSCPALQTAGKFTHLLTFFRTVCYTKALEEFVLAIVNTDKWAVPQRVYEKLDKKLSSRQNSISFSDPNS